MARRLVAAGALLLVPVALAGCAGGGGGEESTLGASGAWARPTPAAADEGVVYLTVSVDRSDAVVGASVPEGVAAGVQLHRTTGGGTGATHDHGAVDDGTETVAMGEVAELEVQPDEPLVFEPGGNHIMLVGLVAPLVAGDEVPLVLELASGRTVEVDVPVRVNPPEG